MLNKVNLHVHFMLDRIHSRSYMGYFLLQLRLWDIQNVSILILLVNVAHRQLLSEMYSGPCQTSAMERENN